MVHQIVHAAHIYSVVFRQLVSILPNYFQMVVGKHINVKWQRRENQRKENRLTETEAELSGFYVVSILAV